MKHHYKILNLINRGQLDTMQVIDIAEKLRTFDEHWSPKVIAELNGQHLKVVKLLGEFDWHFHEYEDELFWVIKGTLVIHFRDSVIN